MSYEDNIRKVVPYTPGEQPQRKVIKLNTNECPYAPSPRVAEVLRSFSTDDLRKYPQPDCHMLTEKLSAYYGVPEDQIFVGVGSDDVLSMCFLTFFAGKKPILFPDITYSFYEVWADVYRIPYETVPLTPAPEFRLNPDDYIGRENGGIVFANANAPTGRVLSCDEVERIVAGNPDSVVVVDEAYIDFGGETALPLIEKYDNIIVTRTMSKSRAMAGMRIGYAFGPKKLIKYLNDVKFSVNSYTMNMPSLVTGAAAIEDDAYFRDIVAKVVATREWTKKELKALGFEFCDSQTNFIFATRKGTDAGKLFEELKQRDIFVRYFKKPVLENYLRITIGTQAEMETFIAAVKELIHA